MFASVRERRPTKSAGGVPIIYKSVIRPVLFRLPPERSHRLSDAVLRTGWLWSGARPLIAGFDDKLRTSVAGVEVPSPVGAAAGLDKEFRTFGSLLNLGFGFVSGGTVTLNPRPGNPPPRILRQPERNAIVNAMGFPGPGLDVISRRISSSRARPRLFVSISGTLEDEIVQCHRSVEQHCAAVEINVSSPNTSGLRAFHDPGRLRVLVQAVASAMNRPLFVKLPPWERDRQSRENGISLAETAIDAGANGVIIANTRPVEHSGLKVGRGGLSGAPLFDDTLRMTAEVRASLGNRGAIIACGGVSDARQVWRLLAVGAEAVQLYTALVYEGPGLPGSINRNLASLMERAGCRSVSEIEGQPPD